LVRPGPAGPIRRPRRAQPPWRALSADRPPWFGPPRQRRRQAVLGHGLPQAAENAGTERVRGPRVPARRHLGAILGWGRGLVPSGGGGLV